MSYASIASHNIPEGEMPKPDQNLADGHFSGETHAENSLDHKINVLPAGTDPEHPSFEVTTTERSTPVPTTIHPAPDYEPHTSSSAPKPTDAPPKSEIHIPQSGAEWEAKAKSTEKKAKQAAGDAEKKTKEVAGDVEQKTKEVAGDVEKQAKQTGAKVQKKAEEFGAQAKETASEVEKKAKEAGRELEKKGSELKKKAQAELNEAENKLAPYWERTKDIVLRPGTLGGLMGVVNVGILGTIGYFAYTRRDQPWDRRVVGAATAGTLALFGAEGYVTESYLSTPEGREEAERAKREGSRAYLQANEVILRPGVFGGLAGAINVAVIGTVGYFSYKHWNNIWDPRIVSAVTLGLVTLSGVEGYAGKTYVDKELPKRK